MNDKHGKGIAGDGDKGKQAKTAQDTSGWIYVNREVSLRPGRESE